MSAIYYTRQEIDIRYISKNFVTIVNGTPLLQTAEVLKTYGMAEKRNSGFDAEDVISCLISGNPVILYIKGLWVDSQGVTRHGTSNGHFLVIVGYDDRGFYLYDPGRRNNTFTKDASGNLQPVCIPYDDFKRVTILEYRTLSSTNPSFTPYYRINTILGIK